MSIINRRNAVLGWGVWQVSKRTAKMKARRVKPSSGEGSRQKKSLIAVSVAGAVGALTFWRKKKSSGSENPA